MSLFRVLSVEFVVYGEPATKARPRVTTKGGKIRTYTPDATKRAEAGMASAFLKQVGRLAPDARHMFAVDASFYVGNGQRRDVDNMLKLVLDGLNKIAWADDHQVMEVSGRKIFAQAGDARSEVRISTIGVMPNREATCEHCGATFPRPPSHAAKKYCSMDCRRAGLAAKRTRACKHCGTKFVKHGDASRQEFCSTECAAGARHIEVACVSCGTEFTKARSRCRAGNQYCSEECRADWWREQRKGAAKGTCAACGGPTSKKSYTHCRVCAPIARSKSSTITNHTRGNA